MPTTYEPIATQTLGSAAATIIFSSIPATYTDIKVVIIGIRDSGNLAPTMILNSDTGTNYSNTNINGNGTTANGSVTNNSNRLGNADFWTNDATLPIFVSYDIFSYAGATRKTCLYTVSIDRNNAGATVAGCGMWRNTAAINTITINNSGWGTNFGVGSIVTLYGIQAA
jgi:hypothetical protein